MKHVVVFTSELKRKNSAQYEVLSKMDIKVTLFYTSNEENTLKVFNKAGESIKMRRGLISRSIQLFNFFRKNKVDLIEAFAGGGRLAFLYPFFSKIFNIPVLLIERGGGTSLIENGIKPIPMIEYSTKLQYKNSKYLMYKEPYMTEYFDSNSYHAVFHIANGVKAKKNLKSPSFHERDIDYLWVNRITVPRNIDWIIELSQLNEFKNKKFHISGFLNDKYSVKKKAEIQKKNFENVVIQDYDENIENLYLRSKYFILPGNLTFGNNSLLEAMSYGTVPIITKGKAGIENLIEDNNQGLISENNFESYQQKMLMSSHLDASEWSQMSSASMAKIEKDFSEEKNKKQLEKMYQSILSDLEKPTRNR